MQLERMSIALRTRSPWEAIDLGLAMMRSWWRPIYAAWFVVVVPIALATSLLFAARPLAALLIIWWLKPLYDRVVLHVLARGVFGEQPSGRETLGSITTFIRAGLIGALTLRRLDIARSFNLPIRQLEGQRGAAARARERVLGRRAYAQSSGLLFACLSFELVMLFSLAALYDLLKPAALEPEFDLGAIFGMLWNADAPGWSAYLINAFCVIAISVIEPLYVASGFALYLNRRSALEAWDLELSFRVMAERHRPRTAGATMLAAVVVFVALGSVHAPACHAQDQSSRAIIDEVLASPDFDEHRQQKVWQRKSPDSPRASGGWPQALAESIKSLGQAIAELARIGAYALLAVAAFFLLRFLLREFGRMSRDRSPPRERQVPPHVLFGLDVRPNSLPRNLTDTAAALVETDPRAALSLLYRGALATLIHRDRLEVAPGDTEADCVQRVVRGGEEALSGYFRALVNAWSQAAYARVMPDRNVILALCVDWSRHFAVPEDGR